MAFVLRLPEKLARSGWKVKIQDRERLEAPHVTIWFKRKKWRLGLRDGEFLDAGRWKDIDESVRQAVEDNWRRLRQEWVCMATSTRLPARVRAGEDRFVLLGPRASDLSHFKRMSARVCNNRADIESALRFSSPHTVWISCHRKAADAFLKAAIPSGAGGAIGQFLALQTPDSESIPSLQCFFEPIAGVGADFHFLPNEELIDVLMAPADEARDLFIGGRVDHLRQAVVLIRGDLQHVVVPLTSFWPTPVERPDPTRFRLTDYGGTILLLGGYEASNHSILYEIDADYRRRRRAKRRAEDKTFGASLGRLRRMKGLTRDDFAPVSSKEIARIERDEVEKPHARTLKTIAARLGVKLKEIETY